MKNNIAPKVFFIYSAAYLMLLFFGRKEIAMYLKPGLEPFLLFLVYTFQDFPTKKILLAALLLSWIGDIILMFDTNSKLTFILGLSIFLITHIIYIVLFAKQSKTEKFKFNSIFLIGIGVVLIHLIVMLSLLLPNLGDLKIPVILYALIMSIMLVFAFKGSLDWKNQVNMNVLLGAFTFAISDSINALNLFYTEIPDAFFWQEFTYLVAQYLITTGILHLNNQKTAFS